MKFAKIISLLLIAFLILSGIPAFAHDSSAIILSINDGDIIYNAPDEILLGIDAGYDTTIILDDDEISNFLSKGNDTVALGKKLEVGKHSITVVAVSANDVLTQTVEFELKYKGLDTSSGAMYATETTIAEKSVSHGAGAPAGTDADGNAVKIVRKYLEGKDGTENGAIGYETTAPVASASGATDIYSALYWSGKKLSGIIEMEYDIKIEGKMQFEFETSGSNWGNFGPDNMINRGKIAGVKEYVSGEWFHMKHVINIGTAKQDLYFNDELIVSGANVVGAAGITTVKVQARAEASDIRSSVAIDNFTFGTPINGNAPKSLSYMTMNGYVEADDYVISESSDALRIALDGGKEGAVNVGIYADGIAIATSTASVDSQGNLDILLSNPLPESSNVKIIADFGAYSLLVKFKTGVYTFGMYAVDFEVNNQICYVAKQLVPGADLSVDFKTINNTGSDQNALVLFAVYNGTHLVKLTPHKVSLAAGQDSAPDLTVKIPDESGDYTAECYMIDGFEKRNVLSKIYAVN